MPQQLSDNLLTSRFCSHYASRDQGMSMMRIEDLELSIVISAEGRHPISPRVAAKVGFNPSGMLDQNERSSCLESCVHGNTIVELAKKCWETSYLLPFSTGTCPNWYVDREPVDGDRAASYRLRSRLAWPLVPYRRRNIWWIVDAYCPPGKCSRQSREH
jgi:hypothetical protein